MPGLFSKPSATHENNPSNPLGTLRVAEGIDSVGVESMKKLKIGPLNEGGVVNLREIE